MNSEQKQRVRNKNSHGAESDKTVSRIRDKVSGNLFGCFIKAFSLALKSLVIPFCIVFVFVAFSMVFDAPLNDVSGNQFLSIYGYAASFFLLSHGSCLTGIDAGIRIFPLLITFFSAFCIYKLSEKSRKEIKFLLTASLMYALLTLLMSLSIGTAPEFTAVVTLFSFALFMFSSSLDKLLKSMRGAKEDPVYADNGLSKKNSLLIKYKKHIVSGMQTSAVQLCFITVVALIIFLISVFQLKDASSVVFKSLNFTGVNGFMFILMQILFLPNMIIWIMSQCIGGGFVFGTISSFSVFIPNAVIKNGSMPALPLLSYLPQTKNVILAVAVIVLFCAFFTVAYIIVLKKMKELYDKRVGSENRNSNLSVISAPVKHDFTKRAMIMFLSSYVFSACMSLILCLLSFGSLGTENLSYVGPNILYTVLFLFAEQLIASIIAFLVWYLLYGKRKFQINLNTSGLKVNGGEAE